MITYTTIIKKSQQKYSFTVIQTDNKLSMAIHTLFEYKYLSVTTLHIDKVETISSNSSNIKVNGKAKLVERDPLSSFPR